MGKVTVYQCDSCNNSFNSSSEVISVDGIIYDGNENIIYEGNIEELICKQCFMKKLETINESKSIGVKADKKETEVKVKDINEFIFLKKIHDTKDEDEFINFIGHVSKESFTNVYNGSLINHYYPVELDEKEIPSISEFPKMKLANVITKVFASIPQVKKMNIFICDNKDREIAIVSRESFEKDDG